MIRISGATAVSVLASLTVAPATALEFEYGTTAAGVRVLLLTEKFEDGDVDTLAAWLRDETVDEVWLHSGGGHEATGYAIGRLFRSEGVVARVPQGARCASACVDAFLGAPIRFVDDDFAIGVHPASIAASETAREYVREHVEDGGDEGVRRVITQLEQLGNESATEWVSYLLTMGVSPSLVAHAVAVRAECMRWLSRGEMLHFNVVNTGGPPPAGFVPGDGKDDCP